MNLQLVNENDMNAPVEEELVQKAVSYRKMSTEEREALKTRVESVKSDFEDHKYLLNVDQGLFSDYLDFIQNKVKFDGKDCLGIPKVYEALIESQKESTKVMLGGKPRYMLTNMHLEALYYYLVKNNGQGLEEANSLKRLLDPILESLSRAVVRRNTLQSFLEKAEAQLHGIIDPDEILAPEYENEEEDGQD